MLENTVAISVCLKTELRITIQYINDTASFKSK